MAAQGGHHHPGAGRTGLDPGVLRGQPAGGDPPDGLARGQRGDRGLRRVPPQRAHAGAHPLLVLRRAGAAAAIRDRLAQQPRQRIHHVVHRDLAGDVGLYLRRPAQPCARSSCRRPSASRFRRC
ncbi:hypothetical protein G6F22_018845 [Rhizopus arrhizus]|nr:hypothetical protein G6F22_018845 [Rhizopus arrhizus]